MSSSPYEQPSSSSQEQQFIQRALANVEKAARYQRIKQIVVTVLAFIAAFWLSSRGPSSELNVECTIIIFVGLMLAVCTAKIKSLINKNASVILQAISELRPSETKRER